MINPATGHLDAFSPTRCKPSFRLALALALVTVLALPALAAVPKTTLVEGVLMSAGGSPAADGSYTIKVAIYPDALTKTATWSEGPLKIDVVNGRFTALLGATAPLDAKALGSLPAAARSTRRGTRWLSPGPKIRWGRRATVARLWPLARSTSASAAALDSG